jgi:hypothetical protein
MKKILILSAFFASTIILSCSKDKAEDPDPCAYEASQLKYNGIIKPIIETKCASDGACHGTPQNAQDAGGEYATYSQVKAKIDAGSFANRVFVLQDMPQGSSLDACEMKKLKDWVDAGAPE